MATEGRIKQKKHENQVKLEAKLHDLEVEWSGGAETMEEVLSKVYQREEAAVKRERAMAYAFSHQWRANPGGANQCHPYEFGKASIWGWSWMERWISARPWEMRIPGPRKIQSNTAANTIKGNSPQKPSISTSRTSAKKNSAQFD
ncbi:Protein IQ-DOMAIN 1 [Platanthera guangdongensis]|uniref:Protein IQ-DOMAIN 1 n=1 Tax=Platanthera guangdongensis TaxID=2320717 RepID=A0ABR2LYL6_9ASPA